ncbi:hypothetical protein APHAL10511_008560 [Amanita phalloides]|nr:hypothetical protein APHAL10511_008560 [Amanita phalloides]
MSTGTSVPKLSILLQASATPLLNDNPPSASTLTYNNSPHPEEVAQTAMHRRPSPRRTRTYPPDSCTTKPCDGYDGTSQSQSEFPSLVAQLQQRHGLTKKKVYGIKPPKTPFFRDRDDPPFDPYRRTALPFSATITDSSLSSPITLTPGGRSVPLSRLDRITRLNQRSPADTSSRRWRRSTSPNSLSSPENDTTATHSPISAVSRAHVASYEPVTSTTASILLVEPPYRSLPAVDQQFTYSHSVYESGTERHWPPSSENGYIQQTYAAISRSQPYDENFSSNIPAGGYNQTTTDQDNASGSLGAPTVNSAVIQESPIAASYRSSVTTSDRPQGSSSTSATSNSKDDEPFTFGPEYIAATTVMFRQEVLPAYPEYAGLAEPYVPLSAKRSDATSAQSFTLGYDYSTLPYLPPSKAGQLYAMKYSMAWPPRQTEEANVLPMSTSDYTPTTTSTLSYHPPCSTSSSSLTGWAG